jgi:hypothetical protein
MNVSIRDSFAKDPFGYSALAWHKWGMVQTMAGFPVDIDNSPKSEDLKSPVLWLSHAHALTEAALILLRNEPELEFIPITMHGICDSQYCAVSLMLVGYSLEICLKAILIMQKGVAGYVAVEAKHRHHKLDELANFMPDLNAKDKAILKALTHYICWAGRYPDPGLSQEKKLEDIFTLAETYEITAEDLFELSSRIMRYSYKVAEEV